MKPCDRWGAEVAQTDGDIYPYPVSGPGWVCFHCGERFTTPGAAEDHFGESPEKTAACRIKVGEGRGLVMALRREEREVQWLREELAHPSAPCYGTELLDALVGLVAWVDPNETFLGYCPALGPAYAAIAKARGGANDK